MNNLKFEISKITENGRISKYIYILCENEFETIVSKTINLEKQNVAKEMDKLSESLSILQENINFLKSIKNNSNINFLN